MSAVTPKRSADATAPRLQSPPRLHPHLQHLFGLHSCVHPRAPTGHSSAAGRRRQRRRRLLLLLHASGGSFAVQSTRVLGSNRCGLEVCWRRAVQCCAEKKTVTLHHVLRLTTHSLHLPIHLLPKCQYLKAAIPWSSTKSRESPFLRLPQECRAFACNSSPA